jgi:hypothetical protein
MVEDLVEIIIGDFNVILRREKVIDFASAFHTLANLTEINGQPVRIDCVSVDRGYEQQPTDFSFLVRGDYIGSSQVARAVYKFDDSGNLSRVE